MQILDIIFTVTVIIAAWAMVYFVLLATIDLSEIKHTVFGMRRAIKMVLTISFGNAVRENFEEVDRMKKTFAHLIESEQYEEAEKLHEAIKESEQAAFDSLKAFKESCGDEHTKIIFTSVKDSRLGEQ
jgi:hypothetical protein